MTAGIDPVRFWSLTIDEIQCVLFGYRERMRFQAMQTYYLMRTFGGKDCPMPQEIFPGLLEAPEEKQPWQIMQERVLAHGQDYLRNRCDK